MLFRSVPQQEVSINLKDNNKHLSLVIDDLIRGDIELTAVREATTSKDFEALRKFAMILTKDIAEGISTPIREAFSPFLDEYKEYKIREIFKFLKR